MKLVLKNWMMRGDSRLAPGSVVDLSEVEGCRAIEQGTATLCERPERPSRRPPPKECEKCRAAKEPCSVECYVAAGYSADGFEACVSRIRDGRLRDSVDAHECSGGAPRAGLEKLAVVEETKPAPESVVETPDILLVEEVSVEETSPPEEVVEAQPVAAAPVAKRGPRKANLPDV